MKVLIVDDHPLALQAIDFILKSNDVITCLADSCQSAVSALQQQSFDYLLLDYHLDELNAIDLLTQPDISLPPNIALISGMSDPEDIIFALEQSKAVAFISKQMDLAHLLTALSRLAELDRNKLWVWDCHQCDFVEAYSAFPEQTLLTPKERQVFMLLRQGFLDKQIAETLNRSIHTIRVQIRSIKRKRKVIRRSV